MRISWLSAEEIAAARQALTAHGASYDDHFAPQFAPPPAPVGATLLDWSAITEHVARAERVSKVVREGGLEATFSWLPDSLVAEHALCGPAAACAERLAAYREAGLALPVLFPDPLSVERTIRELAPS